MRDPAYFLTPVEVASELNVSVSTVLRLIHARKLPAIRVSERIYRIPAGSFDLFKSDGLRTAGLARVRRVSGSPQPLVANETLPRARKTAASARR